MALYNNNVIDDPYVGFNDVNYRWISKKNWTFRKALNITNKMLRSQHIVLVCDGLDTVAQVSLNGHVIGNTSNMFVRYEFDIKNYVKNGDNELEVAFTSPVTAAQALFDKLPYPVPPRCPPFKQNGECHVNMLRKMQASFSWDWGPAFPDQGIWRDIHVKSFNSSFIEHLKVNTFKGDRGGWTLEVEVFFYPERKTVLVGKLAIHLSALKIMMTVNVHLPNGTNSKKITINVPKTVAVKQWWPNGYGTPNLYPLDVIFTSANGQELSAKQIRIGFRTVTLVQNQVTANAEDGLTFYFKVNGIPVFFKGSNWIPADSFQERVTEKRIRNLLQSVVDANQNSIRIWGGGVYESDAFYNIADELGILIWHDFMFAVALYPTTPDFLDSVKKEITYQVRRLMYHPSIAIWAGNNENELALRSNWFGTSMEYDKFKKDYVELYVKTIMPICKEEDPHRTYVTSSPSNGIQTMKQGWVANNPGDYRFGDIHHYDYVQDLWKDSSIPIPRFCSEYGIQSWPSFTSMERVYNKSDLHYWSKFTDHRQHHLGGQIEMEAEILQHFDLPPLLKDKTKEMSEFQKIVYLTQINQAMAIRFETEAYRRHQSELVGDLGLTMGALYWQLNDIWQAPTWASLEYDGTWKMLHYFSRKFFASKLISPYFDNKDLLNVAFVVDEIPVTENRLAKNFTLSLVPSLQKKVTRDRILSGMLYVQLYKWKSRKPLKTWMKNYALNKTADIIYQIPLQTILKEGGCQQKSQCFLYFYTKSITSRPSSWLPLGRFKPGIGIPFAKIKIVRVTANPKQSGTFSITLSSDKIAPFVWLEAPGIRGRFSDNGFLMILRKKQIKFFAWENVNAKTLKAVLTVKSLMDVYH